jgi:hypothetical protein
VGIIRLEGRRIVSIFDIDNYTDALSDAVDTIGDAGDLIGGILKSISPFLAMIPGIGTAFGVAVYAAGAIAAKDKITDAMIGTASAAMPPGIPRIAFDAATDITRDVAEGRNVQDSAIRACRQAADKAGGSAAVAAFDSALAAVRGGPIDQRVIDQGRAFALEGGGQAAAASYDAAVSIARGNGSDQVVIDVARGYINQMGGSVALAAFDTGIALGYGKTLQEAGYIGLHTFARGNNNIEKILNFVEQVGRARSFGMGVQELLEGELATDFLHGLSAAGVKPSGSAVDTMLKPYTDAIRENLRILEYPAGELARQWEINEAIIREAQALMRRGDGTIDEAMLSVLRALAVIASQTFDFSEKSPEANERLAVKGQQIINAGAEWRGVLLSDIRKGSSFTMTHPRFDALTGITSPGTDRWEITDVWRRAFDIGIGTAEGTSRDNPAQVHANAVVGSRLAANIGGFTAAEAIQFERTAFSRRFQGKDTLSASSILQAAAVAASAPQAGIDERTARTALALTRRATERSGDAEVGDAIASANRAKWTRILARKAVPTSALLARDEPKRTDPIVAAPPAAHGYGKSAS